LEEERIARLNAAAEAAKKEKEGSGSDEEERDGRERWRRSSLDVPGGARGGIGFGKRDGRKRWSVCGAERRGDLDLETIWEDGS
jgi:hypothetical protein